jgi:hypothetical protein
VTIDGVGVCLTTLPVCGLRKTNLEAASAVATEVGETANVVKESGDLRVQVKLGDTEEGVDPNEPMKPLVHTTFRPRPHTLS